MPEPDLAGFKDALARNRQRFAEPVSFLHAAQVSWPAGANIDPQTGRPYDPTIKPTASAAAPRAAAASVSFTTTAGGKENTAEMSPIGWAETGRVMLILDPPYASAAEGAESMLVRGESYKVIAQRPDGVGGVDRHLVYGRKE